MNVRDVMTTTVVTVAPATPLKEVARLLVEHRISGVPVVEGGRLLGIVSEADFLAKEAGPRHAQAALLRRLLGESKADEERAARVNASTAAEAMTAPAIAIDADRPIVEAARQMQERQINRLPVVDGDQLVGIITRADIVRSFVRDDEDVEADVRRALRAVDGIFIEISQGVVILSGTLPHSAMGQTVREITAAIPGVVAVDDGALRYLEPAGARG